MANQKGETTSIGHFYNRCVDAVNNLFDTMSFWTHSKDVEFVDGKTAETKVGAINGITSDISGEADDIAASIKCVNELNASLLTLDYDNAVTLKPNASFTPNSNGYVIVFAQSTGTYGNVGLILGNSYVSIQYNPEKWLCISQQISGYNLGLNMLVKKGQQYYFHSESVNLFSAKFVPFK